MLYEFDTPEEYDEFIAQYVNGDFSTLDMEVAIPEVKKIESGGSYVEIGVKHGKSLMTAFLAAQLGVNIVGVDIEDSDGRRQAFKLLGLEKHISFIHGESTNVARFWNHPIDVLFIDANHSYDGCLADILAWTPFVKEGGVILFHDCDQSSPGVMRAVGEFVDNNRNKVKSWDICKTDTKNTSMAKIQL